MTFDFRLNEKLNVLMASFLPIVIPILATTQNKGVDELLSSRQLDCADVSMNIYSIITFIFQGEARNLLP